MIVVDSPRKTIAVFDGTKRLVDHKRFKDEASAIDEAKFWLADRTNLRPELVFRVDGKWVFTK